MTREIKTHPHSNKAKQISKTPHTHTKKEKPDRNFITIKTTIPERLKG